MTIVAAEKQNLLLAFSVSVALVIQHAKRLRGILLPSMDFMAVQYFSCFEMTRFSKHYT
jgi:hypothetical protein